MHLPIDPLDLFHIAVRDGAQGVGPAHQLVEVDADPVNGIAEETKIVYEGLAQPASASGTGAGDGEQ